MARSIKRWAAAAVVLGTAMAVLFFLAAPFVLAQGLDEEIVYIDANGVVHVFDFSVPAGSSEIIWESPRGGYTRVALIDVDRDGDMEIAAARPLESGGGTVLDIYDPVIWHGEFDSSQVIGGIPWRLVTSLPFGGQPALLAAGNLDSSVAGAELLFVEADATNPASQRLLMLGNVNGDGSTWEISALPITSRNWNAVALGDMTGDGIAEVGLSSIEAATVEIWTIGVGGSNVRRIYENPNPQRPWQHVAMGDWLGNQRQMLGAVRQANPLFPTLLIFRVLDDGTIEDYHAEVFSPSPHWLFFGDLNGSGDDEVLLMRSLPTTDTVRSRLFARNRGTDSLTLLEATLAADNGYRIGIAGDFDGDSREEVAVLRNNNLLIFTQPESSQTSVNEAVSSDTRNIASGDLDRNGHIQAVELEATPANLFSTARSGDVGATLTVEVENATNDTVVPIVTSLRSSPSWVSVTGDSASTPATLSVAFDASRLAPGSYSTTLVVSSPSGYVLNQLEVPIVLTVGAGLLATPGALVLASDNCAAQTPLTQNVQLTAPANTQYTVRLVAAEGAEIAESAAPDAITWPTSAPWLTAVSATGIAPEAIAMTAAFTVEPERTAAPASAIIVATVGGQQIIRTVPVLRLCVATRVYAPVVMR